MRPFRLALIALTVAGAAHAQSPELSGLLFGNFQVRTDHAARATTGGEPATRFDVARAYLTVRAPVGDRASVRVTTDVFQNASDGYYGGLAIRLKYAILEYQLTDRLLGIDGLEAAARVGMLQTVVIDHIENFWPRWLGSVALETNGFFSSADVGVAAHLTMPSRAGEAYVIAVNGNGYANAETDRFKDVAARFTLTPFAGDSGWWRSLAITPWYYKGAIGSQFADVNPAEVGPVAEGLRKDRHGIFVGLRDRRLTVGAEYARRLEELEGGDNTVVSPRTVSDRTSELLSGFLLTRPAELVNPDRRSPLMLFARLDRFQLDDATDARNDFLVLGAAWDISQRLSVALDYQGLSPTGGSSSARTRTWFAHWTVSF